VDVDSFIEAYRPEWKRLEAATAGGSRGLARLGGPGIENAAALYERVSGHLAEAQTRFGDPALRIYLNGVVGQAHAALYGARARTPRSFLRLFGTRYRAAIRRSLPWIAASAVVLLGVMALTTFWIASSPAARAGVLPEYVRDAVRDAGGGPGALEGARGAFTTFILLNNVQVALLAFAFGVTLGIGTLYVLVTNATLIGTLAGAFHAEGAGSTFWTLVLPHGFLELTAIIVAAGAGLRLGWSLIDPGDRRRGRALVEEARDALVVLTGVVPAFVLAAIYEGYLTNSGLPDALEIAIGGATALAYLSFLLAPRRRARGSSRARGSTAVRTP